MRFVKLYEKGFPSGYVSTKDILYLDVKHNRNIYENNFVVEGYEEGDYENGHTLSPWFGSREGAESFLHKLIESING